MYAHAASGAQVVAQEFLTKINEAILFPLITLMMAIALLLFLYGAFEYVRGASSDGDRETGRRHLLWGTIGMLVMLSAMAILYVAAGTFGLDTTIDNARDAGKSWNGGFLNIGGSNDESSDYRAPSSMNAYDDTYAESDYLDDDVAVENTAFVAPDTVQFQFYKNQIENEYGGDLVFDEVVGYVPSGQYADNYIIELSPQCLASGGSQVIQIDVNANNGQQFYCVR